MVLTQSQVAALRFFSTRTYQFVLSLTFSIIGLLCMQAQAQIPLKATQLSTGNPNCAITQLGGVKCWGQAYDYSVSTTAIDVPGLSSDVIAVTKSCALMSDKTVKCWGDNSDNQLGTGDRVSSSVAVAVPNLTNVIAITSGIRHNCALIQGGTVKCWGANERGQLGVGVVTNGSQDPSDDFYDVIGLTNAVSISAGIYHTCALLSTGGVKCWGDNMYGELGIGTGENNYTALDVAQLSSGVKQISVGGISACAVMQTGGIKCWGYFYGYDRIPVDIAGLNETYKSVSVGYSATKCSITTTDALRCWSVSQPDPMLQITDYTAQLVPINGFDTDLNEVTVGREHICARQGTAIKCWGRNTSGELGNNTLTNSDTPTTTLQAFAPTIGAVTAGNGQAIIHFAPPLDDSGSPITGFTVASTPAGGVDTYAGTLISHTGLSDLSHLVTGLTNGTSYRFSVTATNALGTGLPSGLSAVVVPVDPNASSSLSSSSRSSSLSSSSISSSSSSRALSISSSSSVTASSSSSSAVSVCGTAQPIATNGTAAGNLTTTDCKGGLRGSAYYYDSYQFNGQAGQQIAIQLNATDFDTYLYLHDTTSVIKQDDDGGGGTNSRIPATSGYFTLPTTGTYTLEVTSYVQNAVGSYSLTLTSTTASSASASSLSSTFSSQSSIPSSASSRSSNAVSSLSSLASSYSSSVSSSSRASSNSSVISSQSSSRSSSSSAMSSMSSLSSSVISSSASSRSSLSSSSASSSTAAQVANCSYTVNSEWNNGFTATIRITNTGSRVINGWSLNWSYSDRTRITSNWNSTLTGSNPYNATNLSWNGTLQPGQSAEFGFQGTKQNGTNASIPRVTGSGCQ